MSRGLGLPSPMSLSDWRALRESICGVEPKSKTRDLLASLRDCCLELANLAETREAGEEYLCVALAARQSLLPQYLPEHLLEQVYLSLIARCDFMESLP
jgi:hypothetical protein